MLTKFVSFKPLSIHGFPKQVLDEDIGQDKRLGIVKLPLIGLEAENETEVNLRLLPLLDMLKTIDKKDRGTVTLKVMFVSYEFSYKDTSARTRDWSRSPTDFCKELVFILCFQENFVSCHRNFLKTKT